MTPPLELPVDCAVCGHPGVFDVSTRTVYHHSRYCELPPRDITHPPTVQAAKPLPAPWRLRPRQRLARETWVRPDTAREAVSVDTRGQQRATQNRRWTA